MRGARGAGHRGVRLGLRTTASSASASIWSAAPSSFTRWTPSKQQGDESSPDELAAALKRRIDPADLLNVTIRPVTGETPRVEIVLPTGGQGQQAEELLGLVKPGSRCRRQVSTAERQPNLYNSVPFGMKALLAQSVSNVHKDVDRGSYRIHRQTITK